MRSGSSPSTVTTTTVITGPPTHHQRGGEGEGNGVPRILGPAEGSEGARLLVTSLVPYLVYH